MCRYNTYQMIPCWTIFSVKEIFFLLDCLITMSNNTSIVCWIRRVEKDRPFVINNRRIKQRSACNKSVFLRVCSDLYVIFTCS